PQAFRGFAQRFCVAPIVTLTLGSLPPERLRSASGLFNLMRNLGGAIGIAAVGTILNDRTNLHFQRIAEHLTAANAQVASLIDSTAARYLPAVGEPHQAHNAAIKKICTLAYRDTQISNF